MEEASVIHTEVEELPTSTDTAQHTCMIANESAKKWPGGQNMRTLRVVHFQPGESAVGLLLLPLAEISSERLTLEDIAETMCSSWWSMSERIYRLQAVGRRRHREAASTHAAQQHQLPRQEMGSEKMRSPQDPNRPLTLVSAAEDERYFVGDTWLCMKCLVKSSARNRVDTQRLLLRLVPQSSCFDHSK